MYKLRIDERNKKTRRASIQIIGDRLLLQDRSDLKRSRHKDDLRVGIALDVVVYFVDEFI